MAKQCLTHRHVSAHEFQRQIGDRRMGRCFWARLPSEGRSERGALVGVLVGRNGGRQKILSEKVADDRVFRRRLWVARIAHTAKP